MTRREKAAIRRYWSHLRLRFRRDGTVEAQKRPGGAWGILYYPADTARHLEASKNAE